MPRESRDSLAIVRYLAAFLLIACGRFDASAATRPNVLVIIADDMGWGDLSSNGNVDLRTPHLDSLGRDGAMFERFFVQPVCAPTRAEFLTGRYHPRGGVRGVSTAIERLDLDEKTVADAFRAAGHATGCFGKWHNGSQFPYHPLGRGFHEFYGFTSGHWGNYFDPPLDHTGVPVRGQGYLPDDITTHAIQFMKRHHDEAKPFFCLLPFNTPHSPMQVPDKYWQRFANLEPKLHATDPANEKVGHTRAALAMCENLDDNVGRALAALDEMNAANDTIVVFFSDNGPNGARFNGGMRGTKASTDEGGVRSPLFVRFPGKIKPGTVVAPIAAAIDLYPTLAALAGVPLIAGKPLDGVDLSPSLLGGEITAPDRVLIQHWAGKTSARSQRFRLDGERRLYDMVADPGQEHDVSVEHPDVARQLRRAVRTWRREVLAELPPEDDRPLTVGYALQPSTELPARDGVPHGHVTRSDSAPNCSYFTNWRASDDRMTWDVEIHTPGRYEAVVDYICPAAEVGSTIELSLGVATWQGTISEAHDPPLIGREHDRFPRRGESFMKDFRPLSLGVVRKIPQGRGTLTLRATHVPGKQVADVWAVRLVLKP